MANKIFYIAALAVLVLLAGPLQLLAKTPTQTDEALKNQAVALNKQAYDLYGKKAYAQAAEKFSQLLAIQKEHLGEEHAATLKTQYNLATCLEEAGQLDKAVPLYEQTWQVEQKVLGPEHSDAITTLTALAFACARTKDTAKARDLFARLVEALEKTQGPEHPDTLTALYNLAQCQIKLEEWDQARVSCERLGELSAKAMGPGDPMTMQAFYMLSTCYKKLGNNTKADAAFARYLAAQDMLKKTRQPAQNASQKLK